MGNQKSKESYYWDEDRKQFLEEYLKNSKNPKLIHFKNYKFPFEDPISDMKVQDLTNSLYPIQYLQLKNYCYPAYYDIVQEEFKQDYQNLQEFLKYRQEQNKIPKGIVFYVHGFSDYVGRFAHLGQKISALGYDFYGVDQRGHGQSKGRLVYVPSIEEIGDDTILFHRRVLEQFYSQQDPPKCFILAHSMGCMQVLNFLLRHQNSQNNFFILSPKNFPVQYSAICFLNPFFNFFEKGKLKMAAPFIYGAYKMNKDGMGPEHKVNLAQCPDHIYPWLYDFDNPFQKKVIPLHTIVQMLDECKNHQTNIKNANQKKNNIYNNINLPIQIIVGEKDNVVCNETAQQIYNLLQENVNRQTKQFIALDELDHGPFSNAIIIDEIIERSLSWFQQF